MADHLLGNSVNLNTGPGETNGNSIHDDAHVESGELTHNNTIYGDAIHKWKDGHAIPIPDDNTNSTNPAHRTEDMYQNTTSNKKLVRVLSNNV